MPDIFRFVSGVKPDLQGMQRNPPHGSINASGKTTREGLRGS